MSETNKVLRLVKNEQYVWTKSDRAWFMISGVLGTLLIYSILIHIADGMTMNRMEAHIKKLEQRPCD